VKSLVVREWGEPKEKLRLEEAPLPQPGWNEVRVRMLMAPVNPSDVLMIKNRYGRQPSLPCCPGFEGVGIVEAGRGPLAWRVMNKRVAVIAKDGGSWSTHCVIPAIRAIPLASSISNEQAASFFVNPVTAWVMIRKLLQPPKGSWVVQTAAAGAVGQMIVRLGKHFGFKTLNIVRREEQKLVLEQLGADKVLVGFGEDLIEKIANALGGESSYAALDPVGGLTGSALIPSLRRCGSLMVYGRLSGEPIQVMPGTLMAGMRKVESFWLSEWTKDQGKLTMWRIFRQVAKAMAGGILLSPVGKTFQFNDFQAAIQEADSPGKIGKVLLQISK
jgi:NADPH2:quinone reductase